MQHVDALDSQQTQVSGFPAGAAAGYEAAAGDTSMGDHTQHKYVRHTFSQQLISPVKRQANSQTGVYGFGHEVAMSPGYTQADNAAPAFFGSSNGQ